MTVAQPLSVLELLSNLTTSLASAAESVPHAGPETSITDGISLLDTKNELLLSYVQNLVFLILIRIKNGGAPVKIAHLDQEVVKKLVELRVYMEKGVRPLEGRLKYQIDKVVRAATDEGNAAESAQKKDSDGKVIANGNGGNSEGSDNDEDQDADRNSLPQHGLADIDELSYRPNPASLLRPSSPSSRTAAAGKDGIYRPPRITPTALAPANAGREEANRASRKPGKSATLDEFVNSELSTAPLAEPSIGSTIQSGGRRSQSQREREIDSRRRAYEEDNFVRLPKETKKERAKKGGRREAGYGGEDWRGLGEGLGRIERLTSKGKSASSGGRALLERSRKRTAADGPERSSRGAGTGGAEIGDRFEKRRRMLGQRNRKAGDSF
ncbi:MAG: hypothetical protein M4579_000767 [Chaenotheca gracillima]|nr:MAG: hypothetical protein M4579_000767 [Chaenotheca gracillima]